MEIFNLLESYKKILSNIRELSEQIERKSSEITEIDKKSANSISELERAELDKRNKMLGNFVTEQTAELSEKLEQLKQEKAAEEARYEEERAGLTESSVSDDYVDDQAVIDEVQMVLNSTKESLKSVIGEDTYDKLVAKIEYSSEGMSTEEIQGMIDYFNDSESILILLSKIKNPFLFLISFIEKANINDRELTSKYAIPIFGAIYIVSFILLSKFVFSFIAAGLIITFIYSMVSTYFLHKMLVAATVIQTNLDSVIDDLHKQILDDRDERIVKLDNEFTLCMQEFQDEINATMSELQQAEMEANDKFGYDNSEFQQRKQALLTEKKARMDVLNEEINNIRHNASKLTAERKALEDKIKACIDNIQEELTAVGDDKKLNPLFLIDVNPDTYAVNSFEFPMQSMFCIYDSIDTMYDFINLFCMQLRAKLNPFSFKVTVCDTVEMGSRCLKFVSPKEDLTEQQMFRILDNDQEIQNEFTELKTSIRKKNKVILSSAKDLDSYNDFMISIDSATEPYEFYFIVNPSQTLYQSPDFIQIAQNGAKVGMYLLTFTNVQRMNEDGNTGMKLVDAFSIYYRLFKGTIKPLTKKAIVDNFSRK